MRWAKFSASESHGRCVLQLWNEERNLVRSVVSVEARAGSLRVLTRRMGAAKAETHWNCCPGRESGATPTRARDAARLEVPAPSGTGVLQRSYGRNGPGGGFARSAADHKHMLWACAYARGHLLRGGTAEVVIGVGADEIVTATVDGVARTLRPAVAGLFAASTWFQVRWTAATGMLWRTAGGGSCSPRAVAQTSLPNAWCG